MVVSAVKGANRTPEGNIFGFESDVFCLDPKGEKALVASSSRERPVRLREELK